MTLQGPLASTQLLFNIDSLGKTREYQVDSHPFKQTLIRYKVLQNQPTRAMGVETQTQYFISVSLIGRIPASSSIPLPQPPPSQHQREAPTCRRGYRTRTHPQKPILLSDRQIAATPSSNISLITHSDQNCGFDSKSSLRFKTQSSRETIFRVEEVYWLQVGRWFYWQCKHVTGYGAGGRLKPGELQSLSYLGGSRMNTSSTQDQSRPILRTSLHNQNIKLRAKIHWKSPF